MTTDRKLIAICIAFIAISQACTQDLKLPDNGTVKKIHIAGELIAGDTFNVRGGLTVPVVFGSPMTYQLPSNMNIKLAGDNYNLSVNGENDIYADSLHTLFFHASLALKASTSYSITATQDGVATANCDVTIPAPFLATILDTATVMVNNVELLRVRVQIFDDATIHNYYAFESVKQFQIIDSQFVFRQKVYKVVTYRYLYDSLINASVPVSIGYDTTIPRTTQRVNVYTDDEKTENFKISNVQSASKRILLNDSAINGTVYTTVIYLDKQYFASNDYHQKGYIIFNIRSVTFDYFNYLKQYELFEGSGNFGTLAQPVEIKTNIINGAGIVGGVYQLQVRYGFDHWAN